MIVGHQTQIRFLNSLLEKQAGFSSFLFWGPEKVGKKLIAKNFIDGILCLEHVFSGCQKCLACRDKTKRDYLFVSEEFWGEEEKNPYGIDVSRQIIKFLSSTPSISRKKAVLIDNAHLLTEEAQNSLLKIIEEPPENSVIILVSHRPTQIFETILSRTTPLQFGLISKQELDSWIGKIKFNEKMRKEIKQYSFLRPGLAKEFIDEPKLIPEFKRLVLRLLSLEEKTPAEKILILESFLDRSKKELDFQKLFETWQIILRDELLQKIGLGKINLLLSKKRDVNLLQTVSALKTLGYLVNLSSRFSGLQENVLKQVALTIE
jgi:DNA polymerase-3 subunit delta'